MYTHIIVDELKVASQMFSSHQTFPVGLDAWKALEYVKLAGPQNRGIVLLVPRPLPPKKKSTQPQHGQQVRCQMAAVSTFLG